MVMWLGADEELPWLKVRELGQAGFNFLNRFQLPLAVDLCRFAILSLAS